MDIVAGGDVAIAGSDVLSKAGIGITGDNVALAAVRDLILQSTQESSKLTAHNQSSSGEIGIIIGTEASIGAYVSPSMAKVPALLFKG